MLTEDGARTWWDLAATHLGDGAAWRELWDLNQGRVQADGTVLTTERVVLQPGWTVLVPATADGRRPGAAAGRRRGRRPAAVEVTVQAGGHPVRDRRRPRRQRLDQRCGRPTPAGPNPTAPGSPTRTTSNPAGPITIPTPTDTGDNTDRHRRRVTTRVTTPSSSRRGHVVADRGRSRRPARRRGRRQHRSGPARRLTTDRPG